MAEFVQRSIEEMLPELEQMERIELFNSKEIRAILKKRKNHEYKLRRKTKQKEDFLQYVQYEISVLGLVKKRRKRKGCPYKKESIELPIVNRIHKLFSMAIARFQEDVRIWLSYIEFCKMRRDKDPVGNLFNRMLQIHNKKPGLWVLAAKWEMEEMLSMDNARSLLQRGLRFNPVSQQLWLEYFRMELLNADKLQKRQKILGLSHMKDEGVSDAVMDGKIASIVFKKALDAIPNDQNFCLSFLPVCRLFSFTDDIEDDIFTWLQCRFPESEQMWQAKALRNLQRTENMEEGVKNKGRTIVRAEKEAVRIFEEGVTVLDTAEMWNLYAAFCLQRAKRKASQKLRIKRLQRALSVLQRGKERISANIYKQWADLLLRIGQVRTLVVALQNAITHFPQDVTLWLLRLQAAMISSPGETALETSGGEGNAPIRDSVPELVQQALNNVKEEDSLELLRFAVEWSSLHHPEQVEKYLQIGVSKCSDVSLPMKELYLRWASATSETDKCTRDIYRRLQSQPVSEDFFKVYIQQELAKPSPRMKRVRSAYEDALREFGNSSPDLWLDFIHLETTHPRGNPENAAHIHWRALKSLDGSQTEKFVTMYTLLQSGNL